MVYVIWQNQNRCHSQCLNNTSKFQQRERAMETPGHQLFQTSSGEAAMCSSEVQEARGSCSSSTPPAGLISTMLRPHLCHSDILQRLLVCADATLGKTGAGNNLSLEPGQEFHWCFLLSCDEWWEKVACGWRPLWGQMSLSQGSNIRYPAYQIFTLIFITMEKLQL